MKILKWILLLVLLCSFKVYSQSGLLLSVFGQVKQFNTNVPISEIEIELQRWKNDEIVEIQTSKSDKNGYFKFKCLKPEEYTFSIGIPNIGSFFIGSIADNGATDNDYYKFEIKDGQNMKLNIILGENPFPWIQREDSKDGSQINFTMLYTNEMKNADYESENKMMSTGQSAQNNCPGLKIFNTTTYEVPDDWHFPNTDYDKHEEAWGIFSRWYKQPTGVTFVCENGKCKYFNLKMSAGGYVLMHSFAWYQNKYPGHSDKFVTCRRECVEQHEFIHSADFNRIVNSEWCSFLNKVNNVSIDCDNCYFKEYNKRVCASKYKVFLKKMFENIEEKIHAGENYAVFMLKACRDNCIEYWE